MELFFSRAASILALLLVAGGCRRESEISVYELPKESSPLAAQPTDPHGGMAMPEGRGDPHAAMPSGDQVIQPGVVGEVPDHWQLAAGSSMRIASYRVEGDDGAVADISLVTLPGAAGGVLDNINRWRTQIGLDAVDEAGLAAVSEKRTSPVGEAVVVDLGEGSEERIIAAVISLSDATWFYKMRGDPNLVGLEKQAFLRWIETAKVKVEIPGAAPLAPIAPVVATPPPGVEWTVPEGWQPLSAGGMRVAAFQVSDGAEVTVIRLGGGRVIKHANVNRWRGQIGLDALEVLDGALENIEAGGVSMPLIDMTGADQETVAAWTRLDGASWFFKLTGPTDAVKSERQAFLGFLKSIHFGER